MLAGTIERAAVVLSLAIAVGSFSLGAEARSPVEKILARWDFSEAKDTLGWSALHHVAPLDIQRGMLHVAYEGNDPYFSSPPFEIVTSPFQYLRLTLVGGQGQAELFWATGESSEAARFTGEHRTEFRMGRKEGPRSITILPFWPPGQKVFRLRIDPPGQRGELFIREVAVLERIVRELPGEPVFRFHEPGDEGSWIPASDIREMAIMDGSLRIIADGAYPSIIGPPTAFDAQENANLYLRLKTDAAQFGEVAYSTDPNGRFEPQDRFRFGIVPDGQFHTYNVEMKDTLGYRGKITRVRLGFPDVQAGSRFALAEMAFAAGPFGPPVPVIEKLLLSGSVILAGEKSSLWCTVANTGGETATDVRVRLLPSKQMTVDSSPLEVAIASLQPGARETVRWDLVFLAGEMKEKIRVELLQGSKVLAQKGMEALISRAPRGFDAERRLPAGQTAGLTTSDGDMVLENSKVRFVLARNPYGYGVATLYGLSGNSWRRMGSLRSLSQLKVATSKGVEEADIYSSAEARPFLADSGQLTPSTRAQQLNLAGTWKDSDGKNWELSTSFTIKPDCGWVEVESKVTAQGAGKLLAFASPELLAGDGSFGESRDLGFFPGLEYLLPGERSSGTEFATYPVNDRLVPHPNKVTIPLMAVVADGMAAGLVWDPLQKWDGSHDRPAGAFASPNYVRGENNHMMRLFVPSVPDWTEENNLSATKPYEMSAGQSLTLKSALFAIAADDFGGIFDTWLAMVGGLPPLPELPYPYEESLRASMVDYTRTSWEPGDATWHRALSDPWGADYQPGIHLHLWWQLALGGTGEQELDERVKEVFERAREKHQTRGGAFALHLGGQRAAPGSLEWLRSPPDLRQLRPDGTFPYTPQEEKHKALGQPGDSSSGYTAARLLPIWSGARMTGSPTAIEAGLKGLAYLDTQLRPEGAQTWELQLHVPDILASAKIVPCYVYAYELTGEKRYLDQAVKWAYRGLPFIYFWNAPDRPIMRYGSIPVFGASWFTGGWFGRIVQWNGLEFADALLELSEHDKSLDWHHIAEGIVISAVQQQRPRDHNSYKFARYVPKCGHVGMYPDAYDAVDGTDAYHWCLSSFRISSLIYALQGRSPSVKVAVVGGGPASSSARVVSVGHLEGARFEGQALVFGVRYPQGKTHRLVLSGLPQPTRVRVFSPATISAEGRLTEAPSSEGTVLSESPALDAPGSSYAWDSSHEVLYLNIHQTAPQVGVRVE